jgi:hypothetical protein
MGGCVTFVFPVIFYFKTFGDQISRQEKIMCYGILAYGSIGGLISAYVSLTLMFG